MYCVLGWDKVSLGIFCLFDGTESPGLLRFQVDTNVISFNRTLGSAGQASCWTLSLALLEVRESQLPVGAVGDIQALTTLIGLGNFLTIET